MGIAKTKIGEYEVLESGTILCRTSDAIMFNISIMNFRIRIHNDFAPKRGDEITLKVDDKEDIMNIDLFIKDALQFLPSSPYQVAQYDGHYLLLSFCVNAMSLAIDENAPIVFNYMWLKGNQVEYGNE